MDTNDGVIVGGQTEAPVTNAEVQQPQQPVDENTTQGAFGGYSLFNVIGIYLVILAGLYIFMIRPQRKKQKKIEEMQNELQVGDEVVTTSGFHGKIVNVEEKTFSVEFGTNKGIIVPVSKSEVYKLKKETEIK